MLNANKIALHSYARLAEPSRDVPVGGWSRLHHSTVALPLQRLGIRAAEMSA